MPHSEYSYGHPFLLPNIQSTCNSDGVSENLRRDNRDGQQPSPITALEPAQSSNHEQRAQNEERNSYEFAERREMLIDVRIQPPHSIESRAFPRQGYPGK